MRFQNQSLENTASSTLRIALWRGSARCYCTLAVGLLIASAAGCGNKPVTALPPSTPPPAAVSATLDVDPSSIAPGQSATLRWKTENATQVQIEGLGNVQSSGSAQVTPAESVTYRLVAQGPGGTQERVVRLSVAAPAANSRADEDLFPAQNSTRRDVYFDSDSFDIRSDQQTTILSDAQLLEAHPSLRVRVEGHCDDNGSIEYNLALGDSRAHEVKQALLKAGIDGGRIETISYGKERPFCREASEHCYEQNRRVHIVAMK